MADSIDSPWLTLVGLHEDGLQGLCPAAQQALAQAQTVFGAPRHLALAQVALQPAGRGRPWPVPFALDELLALRGRQQVVALVSGDPFWFGAGGSLAEHLAPHEWRSLGQSPTFSLVAAQLGWRLEHTDCLGLHASAHQQLLPLLAPGRQCIALLRDGAAVLALAQWLQAEGWGASPYWVLQALGGPQARCRHWPAAQQAIAALQAEPAQAPVAVALRAAGGCALPAVPGRSEHWFAHDGQISKAPVRALTLAALAPVRGAHLWDIGGGSGAVAVEWCLAGGSATSIEALPARAANIRANAQRFGLQQRLQVLQGKAPDALQPQDGAPPLPTPQAVFVGGGFDAALFAWLQAQLPPSCRLVVNAVTLQTQALLTQLHGQHGGQLLKIDIASAAPLGRMHGWQAARTLLQWCWQRGGG